MIRTRIQQCLVLLLFTHASIALANHTECKVLKVGGGTWIDLEKLEKLKHTASGASILLLHLIPKQHQVKIKYGSDIPFARQLHQLEKGELDMVAGVFPTKKRKEHFLFTDNYFHEELFVYAKPSKINQFNSILSLTHATGAVLRKVSYGEQLDAFFTSTSNKITVNHPKERIALILKDRADYFVGTKNVLNDHPNQDTIVKSKTPISKQGVALAFSKVTPCRSWIKPFNQTIKTLTAKP